MHALASTHPAVLDAVWITPFRRSALNGDNGAWTAVLRDRLKEWISLEAERVELARRSVEVPPGLFENHDAREAVLRGASAERLWPIFAVGKGTAKALVSGIKLDGAPVREDDTHGWRHVAAVIAHTTRRHEATARWQTFAVEVGVPASTSPKLTIDVARRVMSAADEAHAHTAHLSVVVSGTVGLDRLCEDPELCQSLANQVRAAASALRLTAVREHIRRTAMQFERGHDRTSTALKQFLDQALGNPKVPGEKVEAIWHAALQRIATIKDRAGDFATIVHITNLIAKAGAPAWAERARTEPVTDTDTVVRADWREAWDHAAADGKLASIDARDRLASLALEREESDKRCRKLFAELVRERTFYELNRRLSSSVKSALVEFVRALARIGRGTGKTAGQHRRAAREAMSRCYDAVPCWIMPTWRVAEQLPADR